MLHSAGGALAIILQTNLIKRHDRTTVGLLYEWEGNIHLINSYDLFKAFYYLFFITFKVTNLTPLLYLPTICCVYG